MTAARSPSCQPLEDGRRCGELTPLAGRRRGYSRLPSATPSSWPGDLAGRSCFISPETGPSSPSIPRNGDDYGSDRTARNAQRLHRTGRDPAIRRGRWHCDLSGRPPPRVQRIHHELRHLVGRELRWGPSPLTGVPVRERLSVTTDFSQHCARGRYAESARCGPTSAKTAGEGRWHDPLIVSRRYPRPMSCTVGPTTVA